MKRVPGRVRLLPVAPVALVALVIGCGDGESVSPRSRPVREPPRIAVDLDRVEPAVRTQLRSLRDSVDRVLERDDVGAQERARAFGQLARAYHAYDLTGAAAEAYDSALALEEAFEWWYLSAVLRATDGALEDAERRFSAALERRPDDGPARVRRGRTRLALDRTAGAESDFRRALEIDPDSAAAEEGLGRTALATADREAALAHFERALALQPTADSLHHAIGMVHRDAGRLDDARRKLAVAGDGEVRLHDPLIASLVDLASGSGTRLLAGSRAFLEEEWERAVAEYEAALVASPTNGAALLGLAFAQMRRGDDDEALRRLREAAGHAPRDPRVLYNLGSFLSARGREAEGIPILERSVRLEPALEEAHYNLANALLREDRPSEALVHYDRVLELDPSETDARAGRGQALLRLGRAREVLDDSVLLLEDAGDDASIHLFVAQVRLALDEPAAAVASLRTALSLGVSPPARERARLELATLLGRLGDYEAALVEYEAVSAVSSGSVDAWRGRAAALELLGRADEARRVLEAGLKAVPTDPLLSGSLARLLVAPGGEIPQARAERARDLARYALEHRRSAEDAETLAMALAALGDFDGAVRLQARLVEGLGDRGDDALRSRLQGNLERYRSGRACCV